MLNIQRFLLISLALIGLTLSSQSYAQATRTWVSGVGDDANPCSRTAPCKTFAGAISKTAASGVIDVLDPGGYGAVTITKSITIESEGAIAGILVSGTNGIVINAGPNDRVVLRDLKFSGVGNALSAIKVLSAGSVVITDCEIEQFGQVGIDLQPSVATKVFVRDTLITHTVSTATSGTFAGILSKPGLGGSVQLHLDNVKVINGGSDGVFLGGDSRMVARNSLFAHNAGSGIYVDGTGTAVLANIENSVLQGNASNGLRAAGPNASVLIGSNTISTNAQGILIESGASVSSFGANRNAGNTINGAPNGSTPTQ